MPDRHLQGDRAATAEAKNIGPIYMEILEQRSRVICGLFEAERSVCNVRGVAVSLLLKRVHLPVALEFRQHMAERGLYRVSAAMKPHKRRMCGLGRSADSAAEVPDVHRGISQRVDRPGVAM
jgi:hypothetical protein